MENNKQNFTKIIVVLIILIGIGQTFINGLNWSLEYGKANYMQFSLGKDFEIEDIKNIAKEVINDKVSVQQVEIFKTTALIKAKTISDEQVDEIINKVNSKYELEIKKDDVMLGEIPNYRGRDIIKPYIMPGIITAFLILSYMLIINRKKITIKIFIDIIIEAIITGLIVLSIYAVFIIPVNALMMPILISTLMYYIFFANKKLNNLEVKK